VPWRVIAGLLIAWLSTARLIEIYTVRDGEHSRVAYAAREAQSQTWGISESPGSAGKRIRGLASCGSKRVNAPA
jgi:hypothetical protein